jgi:UDP-N-acetylmuramate dehydrogenase
MEKLLCNVPLSDKTSFRIGGPALLYCEPAVLDEIRDACLEARTRAMPLFVLGNGSNVLVSDAGCNGLVVDLSSHWAGIAWNGDSAECKSGTPLHALVKESVERGCTGLEKLAGIPGSVGGAVVMNAGAFGQSVSDCLQSVRFIALPEAEIRTVAVQDIGASYRGTMFRSGEYVILAAIFRFGHDASGAARRSYSDVLAKRKDRHPLDLPNCGSVFKNPDGTTAGKLIEQCGLKGASVGAAEVSHKHANFIVNRGGARAADVRALIVYIQRTVYQKTGVMLEPEVVFVGEFEEPLFAP